MVISNRVPRESVSRPEVQESGQGSVTGDKTSCQIQLRETFARFPGEEMPGIVSPPTMEDKMSQSIVA